MSCMAHVAGPLRCLLVSANLHLSLLFHRPMYCNANFFRVVMLLPVLFLFGLVVVLEVRCACSLDEAAAAVEFERSVIVCVRTPCSSFF